MNLALALLSRRRLVLAVAALFTLVGVASWMGMSRQEDPSFVERFGSVIAPWPGADARSVERLVVRPIEDELAQVEELRRIDATARAGVAVLTLELDQDIYATDEAWDEVQDALDRARPELPDEALAPELDTRVGDPESVVLLLTGSDDLLELRRAAHDLEDRLLGVPGVSRVIRVADPGARVAIVLDPATSTRLGLEPSALADQLRARNVTVPGGTLSVDGRRVVVRPRGELASVQEIRDTPVVLASGAAVPLSEIAEVRLEPDVPAAERIHHDGAPAVGLSVVPELPSDMVAFGQRVHEQVDGARAALAPVQVEVFASQPELVASRLGSLGRSLGMGVLIVAGVLFAFMGPRLGTVVASVVPLVTFTTVAVYAMGGGTLHQISIAALVLALGLLVDNAIVMAESVQQHLDAGVAPTRAAARAVRELAVPLGTATGTTLAAFVPMLLSSGPTADFTRSIPLVLMLSLVLSYAFALAVTPVLSAWLLRPDTSDADARLRGVATRLAQLATGRPWRVLAGIGLLVAASAALVTQVEQQFFPLSDRARFVVSVELPEGTHLDETLALSERVEDRIRQIDGVTGVTAFIGRGTPRFYYNLNNAPNSPHLASLVVGVTDKAAVAPAVAHVRSLARGWPDATIVAKRLQQGPPVGAPIEVRITGADLSDLLAASDAVVAVLRDVDGAADVRHDLGVGVPTLAYSIDDAWAARSRAGRANVALALLGRTHGLDAGRFRAHREPIDITVATPDGERTPVDHLATAGVATPVGTLPLAHLATSEVEWAPAAIHRRDRRRTAVVSAELADDATFGAVLQRARPRIDALSLPPGVEIGYGGEVEGSGDANAAILRTLPIGMALLLFFLLLEFNSFRRMAIVLATVPLATTGVIPGLALAGQPFGFMSLLGVLALLGIVVNNAIVLLNVVETRRAAGASRDEALTEAVRIRIRPILLTTATTVAGMLPLALSSSSLWPPLAFAMISGLLASTALTLLAVPALYRVLLPDLPVTGATA